MRVHFPPNVARRHIYSFFVSLFPLPLSKEERITDAPVGREGGREDSRCSVLFNSRMHLQLDEFSFVARDFNLDCRYSRAKCLDRLFQRTELRKRILRFARCTSDSRFSWETVSRERYRFKVRTINTRVVANFLR